MTYVLGISAFYHDSAAAIVLDGKIIAAVQEERFTRIKNDSSYPINAVEYVLREAKLKLRDVNAIVFYEKPFLKFERLLETYVAFAPRGFTSFQRAMPIWLKEKLFQKKMLIKALKQHDTKFDNEDKIFFSEHHLSHAASAFYPSPFNESLVVTLDGVGEWATTTVSVGRDNNLDIVKEMHFPHSIGLLYSSFTYYLGFKVNDGEYKVMGLAPYGKPIFEKTIVNNLIDIKEDGTFRLDMSYFDYATGLTMINDKFMELFGKPIRKTEETLNQFHMDIAASIQTVTEKIILKLTRSLFKEFKIDNLCMAGGVALNCVVNRKILTDNHFKRIWVQPAAGDAGGALGAALAYWHKKLKKRRSVNKYDLMKGSYLGPEYSKEEIKNALVKAGAKFTEVSQSEMIYTTAKAISEGQIVGWFQGRMEFGPRALGARSILADPRCEKMQKNLNLRVKYRESFRPFAPSVLREDLIKWFTLDFDSPYMTFVDNVNKNIYLKTDKDQDKIYGIGKLNVKRSLIPAVTHVDYSARIQTVHKETNPIYHNLISKFKELTGCSVLVNTSFNIRGEPIVCSPKDAYKCFMGTKIDLLVCDNFVIKKENQH